MVYVQQPVQLPALPGRPGRLRRCQLAGFACLELLLISPEGVGVAERMEELTGATVDGFQYEYMAVEFTVP